MSLPTVLTDTSATATGAAANPRPVAIWLLACCALIATMVMIGGITRLTLSGLSITEWQPVTGILPPLSAAGWATEFDKYRHIPQYRLVNYGMSLAEFKTIYWWEYVHRLLGRLIGAAYLLPFLYFIARGRLPRRLAWPLAGIFALGTAQGALGWYMVKSGLADRVEVSQYRLVVHLLLALVIYAATLWIALGLLSSPDQSSPSPAPREREGSTLPGSARRQAPVWEGEGHVRAPLTPVLSPNGGAGVFWRWRRAAEAIIALVALTIAAGGFVAGLRAGLTYNTFPLMDGRFVPAGYAQLAPFIRNWFENIPAVQFDHRLLAETTVAALVALWFAARRALPRPAVFALYALLAAAALQFVLGIATLLAVVPIPLAAAHQAGAILLLTAAIVFRHMLRRTRPVRRLDLGSAAAI